MSEEEKSPYKNYSIEDIAITEFGHYVIQVGNELFSYNGKTAFSLQRAEMFYDDIIGNLNEMKKSENKIEREDAEQCLLFLKIIPLRIH
jgi:hypothetical protein